MAVQHELSCLLERHMKEAMMGDARLAKQVNAIAGNPYFIHRSTIRNWRTGSSRKVSNWRQLATIAVALGLDKIQTNRLLEHGGCPSIQALEVGAQDTDQALLAYWQDTATLQCASRDTSDGFFQQTVENDKQIDGSLVASQTGKWRKFIGVSVVAAGALVVFGSLQQPGDYQERSNGLPAVANNLLVNPNFDEGSVGWISYVNDLAVADFSVRDGILNVQIGQKADKSWHISLNQKDLEVKAGQTYTVRFRLRGDGKTSVNVDITRVADPKTSLSFDNSARQTVLSTDYWVTKTMEFEAIESLSLKDGGARLLFKFGKSEKGWISLDDIEFYEGKVERILFIANR